MMFSQLTEKFQTMLGKVRGRGKLSQGDVEEFVRELRMNLLAADVHYTVAKNFADQLAAKAQGEKIVDSFRPADIFYRLVYDALVLILGSETVALNFSGVSPHVLVLTGLTGSGKTTTTAKLAKWVRSKGYRPLMVSTDVRRPAAAEQLRVLGESEAIDVYPQADWQGALNHAKLEGYSVLLIDTAGRLHVEEALMQELENMSAGLPSAQILYVADASGGQDATTAATAFKKHLPLTGLVLTKCDGDARGGSALSIRSLTGLPIYFCGTGERTEDLEIFAPDRFAGRLLGMGDLATLSEKIQETIDVREAGEIQKKFLKGQFTLEDMQSQLRQTRKLGGIEKWLEALPGMLPAGVGTVKGLDAGQVEKGLKVKEAILNSMTVEERRNPKILNGSRRRRIALGSGVAVAQVNRLLNEYEAMKQMMRQGIGPRRNRIRF